MGQDDPRVECLEDAKEETKDVKGQEINRRDSFNGYP